MSIYTRPKACAAQRRQAKPIFPSPHFLPGLRSKAKLLNNAFSAGRKSFGVF